MANEKSAGKRKWFNLFDIIVIAIALIAVIVLFFWQSGSDDPVISDGKSGTVTYTIELSGLRHGAEELITEGDAVVDNIKNYSLGTVVSCTVEPYIQWQTDLTTGEQKPQIDPTKNTAYVVITAPCMESDSAITVGGGYDIRVGLGINVSGPDWYGSGTVVSIERGDA